MNKLTTRETVLLSALIVVAVWAAILYFGIIPLYTVTEETKFEIEETQTSYDIMSTVLASGRNPEALIAAEVERASNQSYFYKQLTSTVIDKLIQEAAAASSVELYSLSVSGEGIATSPEAEAEADLFSRLLQQGAIQTDDPDSAAPPTSSADTFGVSVGIRGEIENITAFIDYFSKLDKSVVVNSAHSSAITNGSDAALQYTVEISFYSLSR